MVKSQLGPLAGAPFGENHGVVHLHGRGAAHCSMSGVCWCVRPAGQETRSRFCSSVALVSVALHCRAFVSPWLARCLLARVGLADGIEFRVLTECVPMCLCWHFGVKYLSVCRFRDMLRHILGNVGWR